MSDLEKAARIVANNLIGEGIESLKPISSKFASKMGNFLWDVIEGKPLEKAIEDNQ